MDTPARRTINVTPEQIAEYRRSSRRTIYMVATLFRAGRALAASRNQSFSSLLKAMLMRELAEAGQAVTLDLAEAEIEL